MQRPTIPPGIYRHFKGNFYDVIGVAQRVDSTEWLVVYRPRYGERELLVRTFDNFTEMVDRDGKRQLRFQLVDAPTSENSGKPAGAK